MILGDLIKRLPVDLAAGDVTIDINEIVSDSRKAGPGTLFAALPGANDKSIDGHNYLDDAYERGCRVFLISRLPRALAEKKDITILLARNTRHTVALLSKRFFGDPEERLKLIALTGTKGKTTISFMLKTIFEKAGKKVGVIGSNGVMYGDFVKHLPNTTPEAYVTHGFLKDMADSGVEYCILEATSQGFMMHRTDGMLFDVSIYTNISPDHISKTEHHSFDNYFSCKKRVFKQTRLCFVNRDTELFDEIVKDVPEELIKVYGIAKDDGPSLDYAAENIRLTDKMSIEFLCAAPSWRREMRVDIPGSHNVENALGAICIADHYGISPEHMSEGLLDSVSPPGRMEHVDVPAPFAVFIDYAHNKLSMEAMMKTAKLFNPLRILCVFGLDGDRAHIRRSDCGEILGRDADYTILSDTSPRSDDPDKILADIALSIERGGGAGKYEIERDRHVSIPKILDMACAGDIVLIVGTGDRTEMEVHGALTPINERAIIEDYFSKKGLLDE